MFIGVRLLGIATFTAEIDIRAMSFAHCVPKPEPFVGKQLPYGESISMHAFIAQQALVQRDCHIDRYGAGWFPDEAHTIATECASRVLARLRWCIALGWNLRSSPGRAAFE